VARPSHLSMSGPASCWRMKAPAVFDAHTAKPHQGRSALPVLPALAGVRRWYDQVIQRLRIAASCRSAMALISAAEGASSDGRGDIQTPGQPRAPYSLPKAGLA